MARSGTSSGDVTEVSAGLTGMVGEDTNELGMTVKVLNEIDSAGIFQMGTEFSVLKVTDTSDEALDAEADKIVGEVNAAFQLNVLDMTDNTGYILGAAGARFGDGDGPVGIAKGGIGLSHEFGPNSIADSAFIEGYVQYQGGSEATDHEPVTKVGATVGLNF